MNKFKSKLIKKEKLTNNVYLFKFELLEPKHLDFKPGQFINLFVDELLVRAYSIAGYKIIDNVGILELIIEIVPNGRASMILDKVVIGTEFTFSGPLGRFYAPDNLNQTSLIFIATGTGIAPMKIMIEKLFEDKNLIERSEIYLYHGLRFEEDIYLEDHFRAIQNKHYNFNYQLFLSEPKEQYQGNKGRVQVGLDILDSELFKSSHIFICGSKNAVLDLVEYCKNRDIPDNQIHFERFN